MIKKVLLTILVFLINTSANANELESTINKVYDKGSRAAEGYISNLLSGPGDTEVSMNTCLSL